MVISFADFSIVLTLLSAVALAFFDNSQETCCIDLDRVSLPPPYFWLPVFIETLRWRGMMPDFRREMLANVKALLEVHVTRPRPTFLGDVERLEFRLKKRER